MYIYIFLKLGSQPMKKIYPKNLFFLKKLRHTAKSVAFILDQSD